jgi:LysM repeat protein
MAAAPRDTLAALLSPTAADRRPRAAYFGAGLPRHLAWVWQFNHDGRREVVRDVLSSYGLGIALKTHDGADWMSRYDKTADGITGPRKVEELANFFENAGVPFHAWAVVQGSNPAREAEMAADVLNAGARSISLDLEPHQGFWRGTPEAAAQFGAALRWRASAASVITSIDPRPWTIERIPLDQFAAFSDAIAPQVYWRLFATPANLTKYASAGFDPGGGGMTAKFAVDSAMRSLARFNLPVTPVGDGTATSIDEWREFVDTSYDHDVESVGVWRYGVAAPALWGFLRDLPTSYVVQPGDTLGGIARNVGTDVASLIEVNGIANPNMLSVGQELRLPRGTRAAASSEVPAASASAAPSGGGGYTIQPGDTLWSISRRLGTTPDALARLNGIADPSRIGIGQRLLLP